MHGFLSEGLLVFLLAVHLAAVNLGAAAPLVSMALRWQSRRGDDPLADRVARQLAVTSLVAASAGMLLGLVMLLIVWRDPGNPFMRGQAQFPASRYYNSLVELVFFYAVMGAYIGLWQRWRQRPVAHGALALLASTDLMYHFHPLLVMIPTVPFRADLAGAVIDRAAYRALLVDPEIASRVLHAWVASIALAALATMVLAVRSPVEADRPAAAAAGRIGQWGARLALLATLLQPVFGIWVLMNLPTTARYGLLGDDLPGTLLLAAAVVTTLALLHLLATAALATADRTTVVRAVVAALLVMTLMAGTIRRARYVEGPLPDWPSPLLRAP